MKGVVVSVVVGAVLLGGCAGTEVYFEKTTNTQEIDTGSVNALNPSSSLMEVRRCEGPVVGAYEREQEHNYGDGTTLVTKTYYPMTCEGGWVEVGKIGGSQPGYVTVWNSMFNSFMQFMGLREVGKGLGKSGSTTNNNNDTSSDAQSTGGTGVSSSTSVAEGGTSHASQSQQASPQQFQNNTQNPVVNNKNYNKSSSSSVSKNHNSNMIGGD